MKLSEFDITVDGRTVTCLLGEPDATAPRRIKPAADSAIVLNFASDRRTMLGEAPYNIPSEVFVQAGHRALSFDLPHHGERIDKWKGQGIEGFCEAFVAGVDPFEMFVADGKAAIDAILSRGLARPENIFLAGTSRGGYCALRLAAADPRVNAVAAFAPVTDWRALHEFNSIKDRPDVAALALDHYAQSLAGRAIYAAIGNADARVGSDRCCRFVARLLEFEAARKLPSSKVCFHLVNGSAGHGLDEVWRRAGAKFLLGLIDI